MPFLGTTSAVARYAAFRHYPNHNRADLVKGAISSLLTDFSGFCAFG
jgi:hypothetical protein